MPATRDCNLLEPIGSPRVVLVRMCAFVRFVVSCVLVLRVVLICVLVAFCSGLVRSHKSFVLATRDFQASSVQRGLPILRLTPDNAGSQKSQRREPDQATQNEDRTIQQTRQVNAGSRTR